MTPSLPEEVYVALLKSKTPTPEAFRLRQNEDSLSIAATERKARGTLKCKGYAVLSVAGINAIPGLYVQIKRAELQLVPGIIDPDYLEVMGLPLFDFVEATIYEYAEALLKTVVRYESFDKPIRLTAGETGEPPNQP
ncbi:MAG TPA: hypothetical protein VMR62_28025 [Bryobacteraceae bacterium]|jgi:hypothetical protein|nr:hypothetical protein [Bryobacteraceae bacterium]